jgi:hypothetical protein
MDRGSYSCLSKTCFHHFQKEIFPPRQNPDLKLARFLWILSSSQSHHLVHVIDEFIWAKDLTCININRFVTYPLVLEEFPQHFKQHPLMRRGNQLPFCTICKVYRLWHLHSLSIVGDFNIFWLLLSFSKSITLITNLTFPSP